MGEIKITVQTEKRLDAINNLSEAMLLLTKALSTPSATINISNCDFRGSQKNPSILIDTEEEITETKIEKID